MCAAIGRKEKVGEMEKGEVQGSGTYEGHYKVKGLTRTTSVFRFVLTGNVLPKNWPNGTPYTGKWVLLTQYPITEGWDPETGTYTTPL